MISYVLLCYVNTTCVRARYVMLCWRSKTDWTKLHLQRRKKESSENLKRDLRFSFKIDPTSWKFQNSNVLHLQQKLHFWWDVSGKLCTQISYVGKERRFWKNYVQEILSILFSWITRIQRNQVIVVRYSEDGTCLRSIKSPCLQPTTYLGWGRRIVLLVKSKSIWFRREMTNPLAKYSDS